MKMAAARHIFVDEAAREAALATDSAFVEKTALRHKAPKKLVATFGSMGENT